MSIRWPGWCSSSPLAADARRPVGDQRRGDAALVDPVLVLAERRVGDVGPAPAVGDVGVGRAGHDAAALADGHAVAGLLRRLTCEADGIGGDRRQRGRRSGGFRCRAGPWPRRSRRCPGGRGSACCRDWPLLLELRDDPADALVHAVDHRRVDFHAAGFPGLVARPCPSRRPGRSAPSRGRSGPVCFSRSKRAWRIGLVAAVVLALVLGDVLFEGVHRPVGGGVGDVQEERLSGVLPARARR